MYVNCFVFNIYIYICIYICFHILSESIYIYIYMRYYSMLEVLLKCNFMPITVWYTLF